VSVAQVRSEAVRLVIANIRAIEAQFGINRASLEMIAAELKSLAQRRELFPAEDFPPPPRGDAEASLRYVLHEEPDQGYVLRLNSINPGKTSIPHNHTTWAVLVAVDGEELNRVYRRVDDGSDPEHGQVELVRELLVAPGGEHAAYLGDDFHSIHVTGDRSTLHLHLYGKPLEALVDRIGIHPDTGKVVRYNQAFYRRERDIKV